MRVVSSRSDPRERDRTVPDGAARRRRRLTLALRAAVTVVGLGATGAVALAATGDAPVVAVEKVKDAAARAPDLSRVSLERGGDGRLRATITLTAKLAAKDLVATSGPPGSLCLRLYTRATPGVLPPDYLVCVTTDAKGRRLIGTVLAEQVNALPKRVGRASVSQTKSRRSVIFRFSQTSVGRPPVIRFAAESTRAGCPRVSCVDTLPDAPRTAKLTLRLDAPSE